MKCSSVIFKSDLAANLYKISLTYAILPHNISISLLLATFSGQRQISVLLSHLANQSRCVTTVCVCVCVCVRVRANANARLEQTRLLQIQKTACIDRYLSYLICICCTLCVFVILRVYCCSYFRCRTAG